MKQIVIKGKTEVWTHGAKGMDLCYGNSDFSDCEPLRMSCPLGRRIIKAVGCVNGPIEIILRRPSKRRKKRSK